MSSDNVAIYWYSPKIPQHLPEEGFPPSMSNLCTAHNTVAVLAMLVTHKCLILLAGRLHVTMRYLAILSQESARRAGNHHLIPKPSCHNHVSQFLMTIKASHSRWQIGLRYKAESKLMSSEIPSSMSINWLNDSIHMPS